MKTTFTIIVSATLILCLSRNAAAQSDSAHADTIVPANSDSLNLLVTLCDSAWGADDTAVVKQMSREGSYLVRALATALLFRIDTATYRDQFTQLYAIHDSKERADGTYNLTSQARMLEEFKELQAEHPLVTDNRLRVLLMFAHVRETNQWVDIRDKRVSMSRFFRSTFLADIFTGYGIDIIRVQTVIDSKTETADSSR